LLVGFGDAGFYPLDDLSTSNIYHLAVEGIRFASIFVLLAILLASQRWLFN
jgi:hypothetical protein